MLRSAVKKLHAAQKQAQEELGVARQQRDAASGQLAVLQAVVARLHADLGAARGAKEEAERGAKAARASAKDSGAALESARASVRKWRERTRVSVQAVVEARRRLEHVSSLLEGDVWRIKRADAAAVPAVEDSESGPAPLLSDMYVQQWLQNASLGEQATDALSQWMLAASANDASIAEEAAALLSKATGGSGKALGKGKLKKVRGKGQAAGPIAAPARPDRGRYPHVTSAAPSRLLLE